MGLPASASADSRPAVETRDGLSKDLLLKTMRNRCEHANAADDRRQLQYLKEYILEAHRQKSGEDEAYGQLRLLCYYYNYDEHALLKATLPSALTNILKLGHVDYYYDAWSLLVESYLYQGNVMQAISETRRFYDDAKKRGSGYGRALSHNLLGEIYSGMMMDKEAADHFETAEKVARKVKNRNRLLALIYSNYADALVGSRQFDRLLRMGRTWEKVLDGESEELKSRGLHVASLNDQYAYCWLALGRALAEQGKMVESKSYFDRVAQGIDERCVLVRSAYYHELTQYYMLGRDYEKALLASDTCVAVGHEMADSVGLIETEEQHARVLMAMGRHELAAHLMSRLMKERDLLQSHGMQRQLGEISTFLKLDEVKASHERAKQYMWMALAALLLVLVLLGFYIYYDAKLRRRERAMFKTIHRFKLSWRLNLQSLESKPQEELSDKEQLYVDLCNLMDRDKPYVEVDFNRDGLARLLHTNRTYLADAIRTYASGMSISEFISRYRLQYAASLLIGRPDLAVNDIGFMSGFNSRSTYMRLFRNYFGLTPAAFRENSEGFADLEPVGESDDDA